MRLYRIVMVYPLLVMVIGCSQAPDPPPRTVDEAPEKKTTSAILPTPTASPSSTPAAPTPATPKGTPSETVAWKGIDLKPQAKGPSPLIPSNDGKVVEADRYLELNIHVKHEPRTTAYVKIPSAYGELILDVDSIDRSYKQIDGMNDAQNREAEARWAEAKSLYRPGAHEASEEAMKSLVARFPYWGKGHGALFDLNLHLKRLDEAEYHLKQLIAIQASFANLFKLAELYAQKNELEGARALLKHLFETRMKSPDRPTTISMLTLYLMVLMDARDAPRLYAVADQATQDYGSEAVFEYHAVLGLALQRKTVEARARLKAFPVLAPNHPMFAKAQRLKLLLNRRPKLLPPSPQR